MLPASASHEQFNQLVIAIDRLSEPSIIDYATLMIAIVSLSIAIIAAVYSKHQRDVAKRAERQAIHTELLNILYYLKSYSGEIDEIANINFKKLQELKSIAEGAFSLKARRFIEDVLQKMHDMPARKSAFDNGVSKEAAELYDALGIDPNIHDSLAVEYASLRHYFSKTAFEEFEALFSVKI